VQDYTPDNRLCIPACTSFPGAGALRSDAYPTAGIAAVQGVSLAPRYGCQTVEKQKPPIPDG